MMAAKRRRPAPVENLTVVILREIRDEIRGVRGEVHDLRGQVQGVNDRLDRLTERVDHLTERVDHLTERVDHLTERVDTLTDRVDHLTKRVDGIEGACIQGFSAVTRRIESLRDFSGELWRDHEDRIRRLEQKHAEND